MTIRDAKELMGEGSVKDRPVRVVYNPTSGGDGHTPAILKRELEDLRPEIIVTRSIEGVQEAAREWRSGLIVAAGGDGTVNEVINGLGRANFPEEVVFGVLPLGTGNDLAATLRVPAHTKAAARLLLQGEVRTLDAARIRSADVGESFFLNVATGGLGAEISEVADDKELKRGWGRLSYLRASLETLGDHNRARRVRLELDGTGYDLQAVNVTVGNCRYSGAGWPAAPRANPEDGLLDVVAIEDTGVKGMLSLGPVALANGDYTMRDGVFAARAANVRVKAEPELGFTADGELIGNTPTEFTVLPRSLKVIVGPGYTPEPRT